MNKKKKMLLIGAIVLVVLVGAMLVLLLTQPEDTGDTSSTSSAEETVYLYQEEANTLETLQVQNDTGSYTIEQTGEELWGIADLSSYDTDEEEYTDTVERYTELPAKEKLLDKVTDKAKYGLEEPSGTGTATFENGNTHTVYVGDMTPDEAGYYAMVDDDPALYIITVANAERLTQSELAYLQLTLIESYDTSDSEAIPTIDGMTIQRQDLDYEVVLEPADIDSDDPGAAYSSTLQMVSPVQSDLDTQHADEEVIYPLFGLTAEEAVALDADTVGSEYGMDDPFAVITLQYDGRTATMTFGAQADDESYYMTFNDNNVIYRVATEDVAALTVDPNDMVSSLSILPNIDEVATMTVTINEETHVYELEGENDELVVTADGQEVNVDGFRSLYQLILNPSLEEIYTGEVSGEPAVSITYEYREGGSDTIELYNDGGRQMIFAVNGVPSRAGRSAYLEKLQREIQHLFDGETVNTDW